MIKNELIKCINRRRFKFTLLIICGFLFLQYIMYIISIYGKTSIELLPQTQMGFIYGTKLRGCFQLLIILMPLFSFSLFSDSYLVEKENDTLSFYFIRLSPRNYLLYKGIAIGIINFSVSFLLISFYEICIWIATPDIGILSGYGLPAYQMIGIHDPVLFDSLAIRMPHLYNILIIFLFSLLSVCEGVIGYSLSLILNRIKIIYMYAYLFIGMNLINIIVPANYQITMYIQTYPVTVNQFLVTIILWIAVTAGLLLIGVYKKHE